MDNKLAWVVVGLALLIGAVLGITHYMTEKVEKEYSPSPYGPGFDPDRVPLKTKPAASTLPPAQAPPSRQMPPAKTSETDWNSEWENSRR